MNRLFMFRIMLLVVLFVTTSFALAMGEQPIISSQLTVASRNFWQLNHAMSFYEKLSHQPWNIIPEEPHLLKLGTKSNAVLILREHLRILGDLQPVNDVGGKKFDLALEQAVESFQERHGIKVDGAVGNETRDELNIPPEERIKQIAINMQRWANLADKLGQRFILVNIPAYHMEVFENNQVVLSLKAIVGKKDLPTPEIESKVTRIVFNPYWNIPNKIAQNDIAPKMLADPSYMYRSHIRAFRVEDNDATEVDPANIDWQNAEIYGLNYHLRQDPGPENALGLVKFEFHNTHDVYMHDTSAKDLFNNHIRSYSHGCIRLENPFTLVEYLLKDDPRWTDMRIGEILDEGKTRYVSVPHPIPIFVTYITAWVDEAGRVNFRDDLYQLDDQVWSPQRTVY